MKGNKSMSVNHNIKKIYIHTGLIKTASTSIQRFLTHNRKLLLSFDIGWIYNYAAAIKSMFSDDPYECNRYQAFSRAEIDRLVEINLNQFGNQLVNCKQSTIILSDENLSASTTTELKRLYDFVAAIAPKARIISITYVREYRDWLASVTQQWLKAGFDANVANAKLYRQYIEEHRCIFGKENVKILQFEKAISYKNGVAGHFLSMIDPKIYVESELEKHTNKGITNQAGEILAYINAISPRFLLSKCSPEHSMQAYQFRSRSDTKPIESIRGEKFDRVAMDNCLVEKNDPGIFDYFKSDIEWLKQEYDIDYHPKTLLDKKDAFDYSQEYYNDIIRIFSALSSYVKKLTYNFLEQKKHEPMDSGSRNIICETCEWIENNYADLISCDNIHERAETEAKLMKKYSKLWENLQYSKMGFLQSKIFLLKHIGWFLRYRRKLNALFDLNYYLSTYIETGYAVVPPKLSYPIISFFVEKFKFLFNIVQDPFLFYFLRTSYYGYNPNVKIDMHKYIIDHPSIVEKGQNALVHFIKYHKGDTYK